VQIDFLQCHEGECLPLLPEGTAFPGMPFHRHKGRPISLLPVGTRIHRGDGAEALCSVTGHVWLEGQNASHACHCPLLTALERIPGGGGLVDVTTSKTGWSLAWVTLSDKGFQGDREDLSGPIIGRMVGETITLCHSRGFIIPDDPVRLRWLLTSLALEQGYDLVCTTGGTGVAPRDFTPQVTASLLDMPLPGFSQAMMAASLAKTPNAAISRAVSGVLGRTLVINLPGSAKAVRENLEAVLPAIAHALDKLAGDPADCGG
jgi:molybdenum cofactor synthesis domain-containing protein